MEASVFELNLMSDPLLPFRIGKSKTTRQSNIPNWHENTEFLYCLSGSGYFQYNEKMYAVGPGDMVVANSEMLHSTTTDDVMEYCCLIVDRNFCLENGIPTTKLTFQELIQDPELSALFLRIYEVYGRYRQNGQFYEVAAVRAAVLDFLYRLCRDYIVQQTRTATPQRGELVKNAVIYIRKHLSEPLTLDIIADHVGVNKHYLSRLFKQILRKTVFETVRVLRCNEAKHRLESGMSVSQAAHSCGFENLSYFTRTFKQYYNMLPSQCQKNVETAPVVSPAPKANIAVVKSIPSAAAPDDDPCACCCQ